MTEPERVYWYCILMGFGEKIASKAKTRSEMRQLAKNMNIGDPFSFF